MITAAILRRREVLAMCGHRLYEHASARMIQAGIFPQPMKLGQRSVGWRTKDITDWLENLRPREDETRLRTLDVHKLSPARWLT